MFLINNGDIRNDPAKEGAVDEAGQIRVLDAAFWQQFSQAEIAAFCVHHGIYSVPTTELLTWLCGQVGGRKTIEIGAGNGVMAQALGVTATDNWMQAWPDIKAHYVSIRQAPVKYGHHVEKLDAMVAIKKHKPKVVLAAWVTHKWNPRSPEREGNQWGVEEEKVVKAATYIHIGNRHVHRNKPVLDLPHAELEAPWLISRAMNGSPNFIGIWNGEEK